MPTERAGEGTWAKLRRRKVVQWGIVYAAGAWGLLQGLEYVSSTFDWPRQIQQLATLALLVGLPVVLVTAWYHGDQGRQRVSAAELIIITLLFLVGGGIFWRYDKASDAPSAARASPGNRELPRVRHPPLQTIRSRFCPSSTCPATRTTSISRTGSQRRS